MTVNTVAKIQHPLLYVTSSITLAALHSPKATQPTMPPAKKKAPNTVLDKIVAAIRALQGGPKGSSRQAIQKYLKSEYEYDNASALKQAFVKGVKNEVLVQTGQSFRVAADPIPEEKEDEPVQMEDVKEGKGDEIAERGDCVTVAYKGTLDNGYQFDSASKFSFRLGAGDVIKGWDRGIAGMKKGGTRKLVVPPKLAYGKRGCSPDIPGDATLHFIVTLKKLEKPDR